MVAWGIGLAVGWMAAVAVLDLLLTSVSLEALYAVGPLLACAVFPPTATAAFAMTALVMAGASARWDHSWGSSQQIVRFVDIVAISAVAVVVAAVRMRREQRFEEARSAAVRAGAQFSAAFDRAPVGLALLDENRVIVRANAALSRLTGYGIDDLTGRACSDLMADPPGPFHDGGADRSTSHSDSIPGLRQEVRLLTAEGHERWVACSVAQVHGLPGVHEVEHVEDIHDRKTYEQQLVRLADHDPLTGLLNRRRFHEDLARQVSLDLRHQQASTVLLIDLDGFKYINDTLGHAAGDRLLQLVADTLRDRLRSSDTFGRLGGDEFGVLLPSTTSSDAVVIADSLLASVRAATGWFNGQRVRTTASIGLAETSAEQVGDADDVLAHADMAMYAAKDAGRDGYVIYDPDGRHSAQTEAQFRWLGTIREALELDRFTLHAQPILDLGTGTVEGAELLLRMIVDEELITPDLFLPIAERHGLGPAIDRYVITNGIRLAASQGFPTGFRWEINLSAESLGEPGILKLIESTLADTNLPPASLVFEITETAAISNMDNARAFATRLTELGCQFALDDFGAGYGSFYWLKHLPASYIKIDGEFIRNLTSSRTDLAIVEGIVDTARKLGKKTIAEYVTDSATLNLIRQLKVDHAQGYHIGRPSKASQLAHSQRADNLGGRDMGDSLPA